MLLSLPLTMPQTRMLQRSGAFYEPQTYLLGSAPGQDDADALLNASLALLDQNAAEEWHVLLKLD